MGLVATHPPEQAARHRYIKHYGSQLEAVVPFGQDYARARRSGESMDNLFPGRGIFRGRRTMQPEQNSDLLAG